MKRGKALTKIITLVIMLLFFAQSISVSSITYQSNLGVGFTFNPSIKISLSGDLVINDLSPGSAADSNSISVAIATNSSSGYNLSATVGEKNGTDALVNDSSVFSNLTTNKASLFDFADNTWGYSYSLDDGTTWISGSAGNTSLGYNGLPLDNNDNAEERGKGGVTLINTINPVEDKTIRFKIGAKASVSQTAGIYSNVINFYAVANPELITFDKAMAMARKMRINGFYQIQDMTTDICSVIEQGQVGQLIDSRDGEVYYVTKLYNGKCWMIDNLRLGDTSPIELSPADTNIATSYTLPASTTSAFDSNSVGEINSSYKNNIAPITFGSGSGKVGVYYNYCATTAGTFCYDEEEEEGDCPYPTACYYRDRANSEYDICPVGWRLPKGYYNGDFLGTSRESISTPLSGVYLTTQTDLGFRGVFWSSSHAPYENYGARSVLQVNTNGYDFREAGMWRGSGASIRCILSD